MEAEQYETKENEFSKTKLYNQKLIIFKVIIWGSPFV